MLLNLSKYLQELLERFRGDVSGAAKLAQVPRGTLYRLLKSHSIDPARFRSDSDGMNLIKTTKRFPRASA